MMMYAVSEQDLLEIIRLLRAFRPLDIGEHYCRYCNASSPNWDHSVGCPYVESSRNSDTAFHMALKLLRFKDAVPGTHRAEDALRAAGEVAPLPPFEGTD